MMLIDMDLSIVIPVYNEGHKIERDILAAGDFLNRHQLKGEIIIVDDGSKDDTAQVAVKAKSFAGIEKKVLSYQPNRGKGYAVREGIKLSLGKFVMFADSGVCIDYDYTMKGLELLQDDRADIAHASRKLKDSIIKQEQSIMRQMTSKFFKLFIFSFMGMPKHLTDTQCGFKVYKGDIARELFGESMTEGFTFDVEVILRAAKKNYRIVEFPVTWNWDQDTRLAPSQISGRILRELIAIKRSLK